MKRFIPIFLLVLLLAPLVRAADKISDLPASTAPSTNTFIEIADMDAVIKSRKYLFTNLVRQSEVTSAALQGKLGNIYQATNATLTALSTNTTSGTGKIVLESAAGGAGIPGTMINTGTPVTNAVSAALDATGTNWGPTSVTIANNSTMTLNGTNGALIFPNESGRSTPPLSFRQLVTDYTLYPTSYPEPKKLIEWRTGTGGNTNWPYQLSAYFGPSAEFMSGSWMALSNKRADTNGTIMGAAMGETYTLSLCPDHNGPALAVESSPDLASPNYNSTIIAGYDINFARNAYGGGYGKKTFAMTSLGSMYYGTDLTNSPGSNYVMAVFIDPTNAVWKTRGAQVVISNTAATQQPLELDAVNGATNAFISASAGGTKQWALYGGGAGIVEQRSGNTEQKYRLYNNRTDDSNYERLFVGWDANNAFLQTESFGSGTDRALFINGKAYLGLQSQGTTRWYIDSAGAFKGGANNTYDIGTGDLAPRTVYAATSVRAASGIVTNNTTTGSLTVATNASVAGTNFTSELIVTNGITLGGVRNTAWPAGGAGIVGTLLNTNGVTTNGALVTMSGTTGTNTAPAGVFVTNSTSLLIPGDLTVGGSMTISGATNVFTLASGDRWTQGKVNTNGYVYTLWSTFDPARTWVVVYGSSLGPWQFQLQSLPGWSNIYALGHWQNRSLGGSGLGHATNEWLTNPPPQAINGTNVIVFNEFGVNEGLTSDANVAAFKTNLWWFLSQQRASNCVVCLFDIFPRIIADSMGTNFNKMNMWFRRELIKTNFVDVYIPWSKYLIDNGITPDWIDITHPDTGAWQRNAAAVDWCFRMGPYASPDFLQPPLITKFGTNTYRVYDDNDSHVVLEWGKTGSSFTVNGTDIASASLAGTVINSTASSGLLSVDATKTNGIAATAGHITNAWGIFTGETNKFIAGDGALRTPVITASATNIVAGLGITLDGGSAAITGGIKGYIPVPYDCTIQGVTMVATSVGSATIDIWKTNYANFPPTVANTITAAAKPTITSTNKYTDAALSGWVTNVTAGDVIAFNVDSASSITNLTLVLKVLK